MVSRFEDESESALAGSVMTLVGAQTPTLKVATYAAHTGVRSDESCLSSCLITKPALPSVPRVSTRLKPQFNPSYPRSLY